MQKMMESKQNALMNIAEAMKQLQLDKIKGYKSKKKKEDEEDEEEMEDEDKPVLEIEREY